MEPTPTTADLRKSFNEQLRDVNERIGSLSAELSAAQEFRLKVIGGLETLQIIDPVEETTEGSEEAPAAENPSEA